MTNRVIGLLASLQSADDNTRTAAEDQYNSFSYEDRCTALTSILTDASQSVETRCFTAILLRRVLVQYTAQKSGEPMGIDDRNAVLELINRPIQNSVLRKSICGSVAEFARMYSDCGSAWPEMLESLRTIFEKSDDFVVQNALCIIEDFPGIFGNQFDNLSTVIDSVLSRYLQSNQIPLRNAATIAYGSFVRHYRESKEIKAACSQSLPFYLAAIVKDIEDDDSCEVLQSLADLVEEFPKFIKPGFRDFGGKLLSTEASTDFLRIILEIVNRMLASERWKEKVAGLLALSASGEGMHTSMQPVLGQLVDGVLGFLSDPHPRVRHAACNAIGQMSEDFQPHLQRLRHASVFPALLSVMRDGSFPRVQSHAAAAMINVMSGCPLVIFRKHLGEVGQCLKLLLESSLAQFLKYGKYGVLDQIVTTISAVADMADAEFCPYYEEFIANLMKLLELVRSDNRYRNLKGKVIECITLVGSSAGKERFLTDCKPMIEEILKINLDVDDEAADADSLELTFVLAAYSRLCAILGGDFVQYLPRIMGPLLKAASFKPHITLVSDDETKNFEQDTDDWEFLSLGDKQSFGIRTTGLEYKANACLLLSCCARELKECFQPYLDEVADLMIPLLRFYFFDSVRSASAEALPNLLTCASSDSKKQHEMWERIKPNVLQAITMEPDIEVCGQLLSSLAKILEIVYPNSLTPTDLEDVNKCLLEVVDKYLDAGEGKATSEQLDDASSDENGVDSETRSLVVSKISDLIHVSFSLLRNQYLPFFDQFIPVLQRLVSLERSASERQWVLCCFDDLIEFTGPESFKYSAIFIDPMFTMIDDSEPEVRQAVAYGIGLMAQHGGEQYVPFVQKCIEPLMNVISKPESRSDENEIATENAISAISKAMMSNAFDDENRNKMIPLWLSWLPTYIDHDESEYIYGYLCFLIESGNSLVLGENKSNMPHLMGIFANCFQQDGIDFGRQIVHRISSLIQHVQTDADLSRMCDQYLTDEQKSALQEAVQEANRRQQTHS